METEKTSAATTDASAAEAANVGIAAAARVTEKTDRRVVKTRAAIQAAFRKLVKERGIGKVTVSELAREANIDRKTFYLHYDSIDDLVDNEAGQIVGRILRFLDPGEFERDPRALIHRELNEINAMIREDMDLYTYIAANLSLDFMLEHITKAVNRWWAENRPHMMLPDLEMDHYRLRFYLVGAASVYGSWLQSDRSIPLEGISNMVEEALVIGLSPANG